MDDYMAVVTIGEPTGSWYQGWKVPVLIERKDGADERGNATCPPFRAMSAESAREKAAGLWWLRYGVGVKFGEVG